MPSAAIAAVISRMANSHDLVILRSTRRQTAGGLRVASDISARLIAELTCSVILLSNPAHSAHGLLSWGDRGEQRRQAGASIAEGEASI